MEKSISISIFWTIRSSKNKFYIFFNIWIASIFLHHRRQEKKERHAKKSKRRNELTEKRKGEKVNLSTIPRGVLSTLRLIAGIMLTPIKVRNVAHKKLDGGPPPLLPQDLLHKYTLPLGRLAGAAPPRLIKCKYPKTPAHDSEYAARDHIKTSVQRRQQIATPSLSPFWVKFPRRFSLVRVRRGGIERGNTERVSMKARHAYTPFASACQLGTTR